MRKQAIILGLFYTLFLSGGWLFLRAKKPQAEVSQTQYTEVQGVTEILPPKLPKEALVASVSAKAYAIYDVESGQVVYGRNQNERFMPASTTKMMTALVAFDAYDLDEVVTISRASEAIGHTIDFQKGEQITVQNMLRAMMINSGNDAAISLADHHPKGYQTFVSLMNRKSESLGLKNTHFSNVSGVEATDHYSSATDLAIIGKTLMENEFLREIVATKSAVIKTIDGAKAHKLENLNQLLWETPGVIGIKTGWTEVAGDCLVSYVSRDHDLIVVVLGSTDRFADSKILIEWAYHNLTY